jgi:hypothetical protein
LFPHGSKTPVRPLFFSISTSAQLEEGRKDKLEVKTRLLIDKSFFRVHSRMQGMKEIAAAYAQVLLALHMHSVAVIRG